MNRKAKINLGSIDVTGKGYRYEAFIEIELEDADTDKPRFSVCGSVRTHNGGWGYGGQCLDAMNRAKFMSQTSRKVFDKIYRLWKLYHLNDMHAGTPSQEAEIKKWNLTHNYNYTDAVEYLDSIGMLTVEHDGKPYRYGSAWLYEPIPSDDLHLINSLLDVYE